MDDAHRAKVAHAQQLLDTLLKLGPDMTEAITSFLPKDGSSVAFHLNMFDPYSFPTWGVDVIHVSIHGAEFMSEGKMKCTPLNHIPLGDLAYFLGELAGVY